MKILFLIRSLNPGGAEKQLTNLAISLHNKGHEINVALFYNQGIFQNKLVDAGIKVHNLQKKRRWHIRGFLKKYIFLVKNLSPEIILCYLPASNIIATICKPFIPKKTKIVYGVRASYMDLSKYELIDWVISWIEVKLSRWADLIICNSHAGWENAKNRGFRIHKMITVPNGIDTQTYFPDRTLGQKWRQLWGAEKTTKLIGIIGRLDPMKDHHTFLKAASILIQKHTDIKFICIGNGDKKLKVELIEYSIQLGLKDKVIWVPAQQELNSIYNALDICCLTSAFGEGFPNVIGEAMACNILCFATDVGDSAMVIGNHEQIVPPKNPEALAKKIDFYLPNKENNSSNYRPRIVEKFSLEKLTDNMERILHRLIQDKLIT